MKYLKHAQTILLVLKNIICSFYLTALNANEQKSVKVKVFTANVAHITLHVEIFSLPENEI